MQILILGCGDMVRHIATTLALHREHKVIVLDEHRCCPNVNTPYPNTSVLPTTGILIEDMRRSVVDDADVFLALSVDDNLNAMAAQIASQIFSVTRVICHLSDASKCEVYREIGLTVVSSTEALSGSIAQEFSGLR